MIDKMADFLAKKTRTNPISIHIDAIGLIRLGFNNDERLETFNSILNKVQLRGGNIIIPTYSYSYTKKEDYFLLKTPSDIGEVGIVSEYLRKKNSIKRTVDALFSYVVFGNDISAKHFDLCDYESFGNDSLIEEIFIKDGYLGAIGGVLSYLTEIHFLERILSVSYRFDKKFKGYIIDKDGVKHKQEITYYCRDLSLGITVDFTKLERDLKSDGLIEIWNVEGLDFIIETIKMRTLYDYIKRKIIGNRLYLCKSNVHN